MIERSRQLGPEIARLEAVRARLEQEVRLLDAADPDIVEELAIELLGFVRAGDRVVILPAETRKPAPGAAARPLASSTTQACRQLALPGHFLYGFLHRSPAFPQRSSAP